MVECAVGRALNVNRWKSASEHAAWPVLRFRTACVKPASKSSRSRFAVTKAVPAFGREIAAIFLPRP